MMLREAIVSLYGAWRLAHLDPRGLDCFDDSPAAARRSFIAAVIVAPLYIILLALRPTELPGGFGPRSVLLQTIVYVVSWVAYPVIVEWLTRLMNRRERFERYLSAYNWSMVLQNIAVLPLGIVSALHILPQPVEQLLWIALFFAIMGYLWFIARSGLAVGAITAAGLVILDELLSALTNAISVGMS